MYCKPAQSHVTKFSIQHNHKARRECSNTFAAAIAAAADGKADVPGLKNTSGGPGSRGNGGGHASCGTCSVLLKCLNAAWHDDKHRALQTTATLSTWHSCMSSAAVAAAAAHNWALPGDSMPITSGTATSLLVVLLAFVWGLLLLLPCWQLASLTSPWW